jgi:hypothetical protein
LFELIVSQAFYQNLDRNTQGFILDRGKFSIKEMVQVAQNYTDAHPTVNRTNQKVHKRFNDDKPVKRIESRETLKTENKQN